MPRLSGVHASFIPRRVAQRAKEPIVGAQPPERASGPRVWLGRNLRRHAFGNASRACRRPGAIPVRHTAPRPSNGIEPRTAAGRCEAAEPDAHSAIGRLRESDNASNERPREPWGRIVPRSAKGSATAGRGRTR
jgi:hypothetical protein